MSKEQAALRDLVLCLSLATAVSGQSLWNRNLIQNPSAEAGSAVSNIDETKVDIPGWTTTGSMTAALYNGEGFLETGMYGTKDQGEKYFTIRDIGNTSTAVQTIDISSGAAEIDAGRVRFHLSALIGGGPTNVRGGIRATFLDAAGRTLLESTAAAPLPEEFSGGQLLLRTVSGFLLPNTRSVRITLELRTPTSGFGFAGADNIAFSVGLEAVIGQNLFVNGDFETDDGEVSQNTWSPISGWNAGPGMMAFNYSALQYDSESPRPDNSGRNLIGAYDNLTYSAYETVDLTLSKDRIDSGGVTWEMSGWFGGYLDSPDRARLTASFLDATGRELGKGETGLVTREDRGGKTLLLKRSASGALPAGTRQVRLTLALLSGTDPTSGNGAYADNLSFVLSAGVGAVSLNRIANTASRATGAVAPGEMVTLGVSGVTLDARANYQIDSEGRISRELSGVKVYFDGTQAPILSIQSSEIAAVVPFDVDGKSNTQVRVEYKGVRSNTVAQTVARTAPGIFTQEGAATGRGLIYSDTWTLNSTANPAAKGAVVTIMWTGGGQTNPAGVDGRIETQSLPRVARPVTVSISGQNAEVVYAGGIFQGWAGLLMVQARVPSAAAAGDSVPVTVSVNGVTSQTGVTMAVR